MYFLIIAGRDKQRIYGLGSAASRFNFPEEYPSQTLQSSQPQYPLFSNQNDFASALERVITPALGQMECRHMELMAERDRSIAERFDNLTAEIRRLDAERRALAELARQQGCDLPPPPPSDPNNNM